MASSWKASVARAADPAGSLLNSGQQLLKLFLALQDLAAADPRAGLEHLEPIPLGLVALGQFGGGLAVQRSRLGPFLLRLGRLRPAEQVPRPVAGKLRLARSKMPGRQTNRDQQPYGQQ